jgi:crotonobetainyl-CoA:carnitine CoA-transferase CaiB-like acyl-CoA transferase
MRLDPLPFWAYGARDIETRDVIKRMAVNSSVSSGSSSGPLAGIRVIECGVLLAGPFCARLLADFGAEVIKIEPPGQGDPMRTTGQALEDGKSLWWPSIARNKKCITLNLRVPEGQELLRRLIAQADVLVENFRPGTLEGWGLGYDVLRQLNPRLVFARVSGYGQTGPYRAKPGFAAVAEAFGGLRHLVGFPDRPPCRVGISLGDSLAGLFAALGTLMALYHRDVNGGQGQVVDTALYEAVFAVLEGTLTEYDRTGFIRTRTGTLLPGFAPSNLYPCQGGQWIVIAANTDSLFRRLCTLMGREELVSDPRFANQVVRVQNREAIDEIVAAWTATQDLAVLLPRLEAAAIPAGPVYTIADIVQDPHFQARDMFLTLHDRLLGALRVPGIVPKLSETPGEARFLGPTLGEHNHEVYGSLLGLSPAEIDSLTARGVI